MKPGSLRAAPRARPLQRDAAGRRSPPETTMDPGPPRSGPALATVVALGTMLLPLNSTMVAVALPDVVADLDTGLPAASWLVSSYLIAMAALQPVAGKLGDRVGR